MALAASALLAACGGGDAPADGATAAESTSYVPSARILAASGDLPARTGGTATQNVSASVITVRATSNLVDGIGALLQLRYNGAVIAAGEVRSSAPTDMSFTVRNVIDGGTLDVIVSNAEPFNGSAARLVTVTAVLVNGTAFSPTGAGVTFDIGWGAAAFDGAHVRAGSTRIDSNGALRIPMPAASQLGAMQPVDPSAVSADPGPYVDWNRGSDSNPGTIDRPFQTLARLTRNIVPLLPGENIHLRCGQMWRETLALNVNQLVDGVQIVPYGADCATAGRPTLSGADQFVGGWARSGALWSRAMPAGTPKITRMFVNFTPMRPAQWPNASQPQVLLQGAAGTRQVTIGASEAAALAGRNLSGAALMLRTQAWNIEALRLANRGGSGSSLNLASSPAHMPSAGQSWLLGDKLWMLDEPGEFFHDVAAQRLYLYPLDSQADLDLNAAIVEGSVRDLVLDVRGRSRLVIRGIGVRASRQDGLRLTDAPQAQLSDLDVRENGAAGVRLWQWSPLDDAVPGPIVETSLFTGNGEYGIDAKYVSRATIRSNRVVETGTLTYTGPVNSAIAAGPGAQVLDNTIDGAGYIGIRFSGLQGSTVARNDISRYCLRLSDCGGINTWTGPAGVSPLQSSVVDSNRLNEAAAASAGSPDAGNFLVAGIYIDDHSSHVVVRGNTMAKLPVGIFIHNTSYTTVENNRIWLASQVALWGSMDRTDGDWMTGNIWRNNEIVPTVHAIWTDGQLPSFKVSQAFWFWHNMGGEAALGTGRNEFTGNRVIQAQGPVSAHAWLRGLGNERYVDAGEWQVLNPGEPTPSRPVRFDPMLTTLGPEQVVDAGFDAGLTSWRTYQNPAGSGYAVQPLASLPGCIGSCMQLTAGHPYDLLASIPSRLRAGALYLYRWTAVMPPTSGAVVGPPYVSREVSPWDVMADAKGFGGYIPRHASAGETLMYESYFMPKSSAPARVNLQVETGRVPVAFDSISIREIIGFSLGYPWDWAAVAYAPRDATRTVGCADLGWPGGCSVIGAGGEAVTLPLTLPAGTARFLMRGDSPFRRL
jgi:hypothetical protein